MKTNILLLLILYSASAHGLAMTEVPLDQTKQKSGWYDLIGRAIAPLKSGYGYSDEEKAQARLEIARLEEEKARIEPLYKEMVAAYRSGDREKGHRLLFVSLDYNALNDKIHQQKIITGEEMSFKRKLVWSGVALMAVTLGGAAYQYFVKSADKSKQKFQWPTEDQFPSYESPEPVDVEKYKGNIDSYVNALKKNLRDIQAQAFFKIDGSDYYNPKYNTSDEKYYLEKLRDAMIIRDHMRKEEKEERLEALFEMMKPQ